MTILHSLITRHLRGDEADPAWPDRDRLLAAGPGPHAPHATILDGPPGLILGAATGMAMAERALAARFGRSLVDHRTWVAARPSDLVAGVAQEAALIAGTLLLDRLAVLVTLPKPAPGLMARYQAAGWNIRLVAAGDRRAADGALAAAARSRKPTLIAEHGVLEIAEHGVLEIAEHGVLEIAELGGGAVAENGVAVIAGRGKADIDEHDGADPAADVPTATASPEAPGRSGGSARRGWLKRLRRHASRDAFQHAQSGFLPPGWHKPVHEADASEPHSTAACVRLAMKRLAATLPDLAPFPPRDAPPPEAPAKTGSAQALPWDALGQAASGITLGMALHGGSLLVGWFDGPHRPGLDAALSEASRLGLRMLHIVSAREIAAIPAGVPCFWPADGAEARDCLILALRHAGGPAILAVSPDPPPALPADTIRLCARGAYLLRPQAARDVTLIASGPEVAHALALAERLGRQGVRAATVSMPSRTLFDAQDAAYRAAILGQAPRIVFSAHDPASFIGLAGPADFVAGVDWERLADLVPRSVRRADPQSMIASG